ncbi:undecaprenyldiphospho-muramoylpentapeptide beta-N-acetylglucosaminyltransferase [Silvibacterium dinghuense]|uniref:UDP-N-acetylglucosamine--N-acetylmuramyl-(pentapeptide) pyrophosphoryl-undecaprenol N-acetylglucosamine transferase n=1 Tax=Silvibacterium dinghuense TaxID=1560006 RepID=A0A4Q1SIB7_9BACT|nr:undecaprenyldiphospho-muramoylpentapeptide beta-N-acetylglucosaminyltransferase [Silvibacterium dinghuense]RXS97135.1 undecaprenyldiphospho-muramoylpentapeptide beta-N-acetylglucosaminyltransferase [Silvibacterium dinghuense]GGG96522.1 UDP-N-acetylglucosamine--N-acetylmuramyl-(pentapeptide) pyrophosphoryl-undecaprenol N-acetylglucosamine transferase [Silvibacterium dinghuense]
MRILIAGGGTGGHIIPALAIADELKALYGAEILFVGTPRGLESKLVPQAGYPLELINVGQLKNVSLLTRLRTLADLPLSILHCRTLLRRFRPDAVVGVGGYASGPAMGAAVLSGIPTLAFEPNAFPGLANRLVGKRVSAAAVNFAPAAKFFRNAEITGIPVRKEFFTLPPRPEGAPPHLLVFGGSQGARALNALMPRIAAQLLDAVPGLTILHQAGARHAETTLAAYQQSGADPARWQVAAFLDDMGTRFAAADLVLARSGASTVAELAAAGKPSLLIPFPQAADDHQRKNAEVLASAGAAEMLIEADTTAEKLDAVLTALLGDPARLRAMSARARTLAHPDASERIARMVARIAGKA